jgi:hypothetical protein
MLHLISGASFGRFAAPDPSAHLPVGFSTVNRQMP